MPPERPDYVVLAGVAALVAGAVGPWVVRNPFHDGLFFLVHLPGMDSGLELPGLVTLPLAVVAAFLPLWNGPRTTPIMTGVGIVSAFLAIANLTTYGIGGMFVSGPGVYLTLIGGLLLIAVAARTPRSPASCA